MNSLEIMFMKIRTPVWSYASAGIRTPNLLNRNWPENLQFWLFEIQLLF